jgi:hypothetical protein
MQGRPIPRIVHFIHGLSSPPVKFTLIHYLAMRSAHVILNATRIYLHYHTLPDASNEWFSRARPFLTLRRLSASRLARSGFIFGRTVEHFAHKADMLRQEILLKYGGVYMDVDCVALRSWDAFFSASSFGADLIVAHEKKTANPSPHGIGNGILIAQKASRFLRSWYAAHRLHFEHKRWALMSVNWPNELAQSKSGDLLTLSPAAFYTPVWDPAGMAELYEKNDFDLKNNWAVHLWASNRERISSIAELCALQTTFGRIGRLVWLAGGNERGCDNVGDAKKPQ